MRFKDGTETAATPDRLVASKGVNSMSLRSNRFVAIALTLLLSVPAVAAAAADLPEEIVSKRIRILSSERYQELHDEWKAYTKAHPDDPFGWAQLSRAARYAGEPCEVYVPYAEKAVEKGPNNANALSALGCNFWQMWCGSAKADPAAAERYLERALIADPDYDEPHYSLWPMKLSRGDRAGAAAELASPP